MRHENALSLLTLGRRLAGSAEGMTLEEITAELGCSRRTAERMRDALRDLFPQMQELADGPRKRYRIPGGLDSIYQTPTADELAELILAQKALEASGGHARAALLRTLYDKIGASLPGRARNLIDPDLEVLDAAAGYPVQAGPRPLADPATLTTIRMALKGACGLRIMYRSASDDGPRSRRVSPWGVLYGRAYYLIGPEDGRDAPVPWRLDRMTKAEVEGTATPPPAGWTMTDYAAASFGVFHEPPSDVVLRFSQDAAADARRFLFHPTQAFEPRPDGTLIIRFTAGGMLELSRHLFTWGTTVEVLAPDGLRALLRETLAAALAHHEATPLPATATAPR